MRAAKFITLTKLTYNKNIQLNLVCITVKCIKEKRKLNSRIDTPINFLSF